MSRHQENFGHVGNVWDLHRKGHSQREIADIVGIPRTSVQRILQRGDPSVAPFGKLLPPPEEPKVCECCGKPAGFFVRVYVCGPECAEGLMIVRNSDDQSEL